MYNLQLETFLRVADAGSFHKAAEEAYITPTAVIKQMNLLESTLDVKLFERSPRGLKLTKAGKSLYQDTKYVVQYCKDSVTRAQNAMQEDTHMIRIGSSPMTPAQQLMQLWPKIREQCPDMKFQIVPFENTPERAKEILFNFGKEIDVCAGIFDEALFGIGGFAGTELTKEPFCCAVSIHHPLAEKDRLTVQDLYGEKFMLMSRGWGRYVDELRDDLWKNHPRIEIIDFNFYNTEIFNHCENSNYILMAIPSWANVHPLLKVIPVDWEYSIPYGILHNKKPAEHVKRFLDAARIAATEYADEKKKAVRTDV